MSKKLFCEISDLYLRYLRDVAYHITTFQKEKCVRLSALSELSFAGGWPGQSTFHLGTMGMAMKGPSSTLVVCVEGEGALVAAKWEPCRFQHQYLLCGAPVYSLKG